MFSIEELKLAYARVQLDYLDRNFVRLPNEPLLFKTRFEDYLTSLKSSLDSGNYVPDPLVICDVPKGKGGIRMGSILSFKDRIIYHTLLLKLQVDIFNAVQRYQSDIDYSYHLEENPNKTKWINNRFKGWNKFREDSLLEIERGIPYTVITDISGFYDNIDISLLVSDLKSISEQKTIIDLLSKCLNKWSQINGRGIPQGQSPSDILAKLYLRSLDQALQSLGYNHKRYVDDIRIFCNNKSVAKNSLIELTRILRNRGLSIQTAKTLLLKSSEARNVIDGVIPIIQAISKEYEEKSDIGFTISDPFRESESEPIDEKIDKPHISVIKETYKAYFMDTGSKFDKSLFRYLLNRLEENKDTYAVRHILTLLEPYPEETNAIMKHIKNLGMHYFASKILVETMKSEDFVYDYQIYEILEILSTQETKIDDEVVNLCREIFFTSNKPYYLKSICLKILGNYGNESDLERIEASYPTMKSDLEKTDIIFALKRFEKDRRNRFFSNIEKENELNQRAVNYVKSASA